MEYVDTGRNAWIQKKKKDFYKGDIEKIRDLGRDG